MKKIVLLLAVLLFGAGSVSYTHLDVYKRQASNCVRKTDDYLKLFPISQDAYQSNDKLTQNPGYPAFK